jgi:ribosomal protein L7/L12
MQQGEQALIVLTVVLAVAVLALLVWLGQRGKVRDDRDEQPTRPERDASPAPAPTPPPAGLERVQAALAAGQKIEAIKHYRELTGVGLKEAKDAVDALEQGRLISFTPSASAPPDLAEVTRLARGGQLIQAIKLHRELTGLGLKESKDAVERLRDEG